MPSGGITITPGYQLAPGEKINNAKLNQGFQPIGQVNAGAITDRELDEGIATVINSVKGRNILCNGSFQVWTRNTPFTGLVSGGFSHEYGWIQRWVVANDANRTVTREAFPSGSTDVPGGIDFLRWVQSASLVPNPAYLGQRLEDVRRFSSQKMAFSIYLRATSALSVTPQVRQVFGLAKRTIANTISALGGSSGTIIDGARTFRPSDLGAAIVITGPGFTTVTSTITAFGDEGVITIAATIVAAASGLTAAIAAGAGSDAATTSGTVLTLTAGQWTRLVQVFDVPDVSGKTIADPAFGSFTEFRILVPQGITFQIDFTNAQLEYGTGATAFERRLFPEDLAYARYYRENKIMTFSTNITTWKPFISLAEKRVRPTLVVVPNSGTGGAAELRETDVFVTQSSNHSAVVNVQIGADAEIRD